MQPFFKHLRCIVIAFLLAASALAEEESALNSLAALNGVWQAEFNHDGNRTLIQMRGGQVGLFDTDTGKPVVGDLGAMAPHGSVLMNNAAKTFLVAFSEGGVRGYDATTAKAVSARLNVKPVESWMNSDCFSPDGRSVVLFEQDGATNAFDLESGRLLARITLDTPLSEQIEPGMQVKFSADGERCFIMDAHGALRCYRTTDWQPEGKTIVHPHQDSYSFGFELSRDGQWVLTSDGAGELGPKTYLQLWQLGTAEPVGKAFESSDGIGGSFLPGGRRLLVRPSRGTASAHEIPSLEHVFSLRAHDDVYAPSVRLTPDAQWFLSWGANDSLLSTDAQTGKIDGVYSSKAHVENVLVSPDSKQCYVFYNNTAFLLGRYYDYYVIKLSLPELKVMGSIRMIDYVSSVKLSPDGSRLLFIRGWTDREKVHIYDAHTLNPILPP